MPMTKTELRNQLLNEFLAQSKITNEPDETKILGRDHRAFMDSFTDAVAYQVDLTRLSDTLTNTNTSVTSLQTTLTNATRSIGEINTNIVQINTSISGLEDRIEELEQADLIQGLENANTSITANTNGITRIDGEITTINASLTSLADADTGLTGRIDTIVNTTIPQINTNITNNTTAITTLDERIDGITSDVDAFSRRSTFNISNFPISAVAVYNETIYVADRNDRLSSYRILGTPGTLVDTFNLQVTDSGDRGAAGLAFYNDEMYFAQGDDVFIYSPEITFRRQWQTAAQRTPGFRSTGIQGMAIHNDEVYLLFNGAIEVYSLSGNYRRFITIDTEGLNGPRGLTILNDEFYLTAFTGIYIYSLTGEFRIRRDYAPGGNSVAGITTYDGNLYIGENIAGTGGSVTGARISIYETTDVSSRVIRNEANIRNLTNTINNLPTTQNVRNALTSATYPITGITAIPLNLTEDSTFPATDGQIRTVGVSRAINLDNRITSDESVSVKIDIGIENITSQLDTIIDIQVTQSGNRVFFGNLSPNENRQSITFDILPEGNLILTARMYRLFEIDAGVTLSRTLNIGGSFNVQGLLYNSVHDFVEGETDAVRNDLTPRIDNLDAQITATNTGVAANTAFRNLFTTEEVSQDVATNFLVNNSLETSFTVTDETPTLLQIGFSATQQHAGFTLIRTRNNVATRITPDVIRSDPRYFYANVNVIEDDVLTAVTTRTFETTRLHTRVGRLEAQTGGIEDIIHSDAIRLLEDASVASISGNETDEPTQYNISLSNNEQPFAQEFNDISSNNEYFIVNPRNTPADGADVLTLNGVALLRRNGANINALIRVPATEATTRNDTVFLPTATEPRTHRLDLGSNFQAERAEIAMILPDELITDRQITFNWSLYVNGNLSGTGTFNTNWLNTTHADIVETINIGAGNIRLSVQSITSGGQRNFFLRSTPSVSGGGVGAVIAGSYLIFDASYNIERNIPAQPESSREVLFQRVTDPLIIGIDASAATWHLIGNFDTIDTDYSISNALSSITALGGMDAFDVYPVRSGQIITSATIVSLEAHKNIEDLGLFVTETGANQTTLTIPARVAPNEPMVYLDTFDTSRSDDEVITRTLTASQLNGINILYCKFASNRSDGLDRYDDAWIDLRSFRARNRTEEFGTNDAGVRLQAVSSVTGGELTSLTLSGTGSGSLVINIVRGY